MTSMTHRAASASTPSQRKIKKCGNCQRSNCSGRCQNGRLAAMSGSDRSGRTRKSRPSRTSAARSTAMCLPITNSRAKKAVATHSAASGHAAPASSRLSSQRATPRRNGHARMSQTTVATSANASSSQAIQTDARLPVSRAALAAPTAPSRRPPPGARCALLASGRSRPGPSASRPADRAAPGRPRPTRRGAVRWPAGRPR